MRLRISMTTMATLALIVLATAGLLIVAATMRVTTDAGAADDDTFVCTPTPRPTRTPKAATPRAVHVQGDLCEPPCTPGPTGVPGPTGGTGPSGDAAVAGLCPTDSPPPSPTPSPTPTPNPNAPTARPTRTPKR